MLPGKSGYEVVQGLRAQGVWTPILILSAKDGEYDLADAFDLGADDYLVKPFSFVVLFARLRALVRRGAPERPAVLNAGDLELDPARHRVTRGGRELTLTPREFSVLEFLMRTSWQRGQQGGDRAIGLGHQLRRATTTSSRSTSAICGARSTLPFSGNRIETVRGVGYRLVDG